MCKALLTINGYYTWGLPAAGHPRPLHRRTNQRNWHNASQWRKYAHRKLSSYLSTHDTLYKLFCMLSSHFRIDNGLTIGAVEIKTTYGTSITR